ncbi:MAG: dipeptidase PepE [Chitinophagaceae bacterium]|nr:dipeptidase PepE [Chitinophagaceae bacterium]
MIRVLAFSSSRVGNSGYLEPTIPFIKDFLGAYQLTIAFIPFATAGTYDDYLGRVRKALKELPYNIEVVRGAGSKDLLRSCDVILTGGGNTFKLLYGLYEHDLLDIIRERVLSGLPYMGWSAGANILGPTICTTNDMPIIYPPSLKALNIFPFQINPHYKTITIPGFHGETRDDRLNEFLEVNPNAVVIAMPEGSVLLAESGTIIYKGSEEAYRFSVGSKGIEKTPVSPGDKIVL